MKMGRYGSRKKCGEKSEASDSTEEQRRSARLAAGEGGARIYLVGRVLSGDSNNYQDLMRHDGATGGNGILDKSFAVKSAAVSIVHFLLIRGG
jgi:hypothetical protein